MAAQGRSALQRAVCSVAVQPRGGARAFGIRPAGRLRGFEAMRNPLRWTAARCTPPQRQLPVRVQRGAACHAVSGISGGNSDCGGSGTRSSNGSRGLKPRIVLVGWLGAQQRHFEKYVQLWQGLGHDTLAFRPPTAAILAPPLGDWAATGLLGRLRAAGEAAPGQPVVFHVFSNAGFLFLGTALRLATLRAAGQAGGSGGAGTVGGGFSAGAAVQKEAPQPELNRAAGGFVPGIGRIDGIVIDSAPAPITADIASRGFVAAVLGEAAAGVEARHPRLIRAAATPLGALLRAPPISRRSAEVWAAWGVDLAAAAAGAAAPALLPASAQPVAVSQAACAPPERAVGQVPAATAAAAARNQAAAAHLMGSDERLEVLAAAAPTAPQLCLFSGADVLIPRADVCAFSAAQEARGVRVTTKDWRDSAHCEHYRVHPEQYAAELRGFLKGLDT